MSEYQKEQGSEVRFVKEGYGENGMEEKESGYSGKDRQVEEKGHEQGKAREGENWKCYVKSERKEYGGNKE